MNFELFKIWAELQKIDLERLSWQQTKCLINDFENEKEQNSFDYQRASMKYAVAQS